MLQVGYEDTPEELLRIRHAFQGVDVVVNAVNTSSTRIKDIIAEAAIEEGARIYFPSEFGM